MPILNDIRHIKKLDLDWIDIPKNGSSTIRKALAENGLHHRPIRRIEENIPKLKAFAMLRDPYDRVISAYYQWRRNHMDTDFSAFTMDDPFNWWLEHWLAKRYDEETPTIPQSRFLEIAGQRIDVVTFAWNFRDLFDFLGISEYGHENKSRTYPVDFTKKTYEIIRDIYKEDFELWQKMTPHR